MKEKREHEEKEKGHGVERSERKQRSEESVGGKKVNRKEERAEDGK